MCACVLTIPLIRHPDSIALCVLTVCSLLPFVFFFFFKQKTAYEMRISDWSSDVCSSDLTSPPPAMQSRPARDELRRTELPPSPSLSRGPTTFTHLVQERPALATQRLSSRDLFPGPNARAV